MSNGLIKDTLRTIKNNFSRYISLLLIVALGTAFYVGIKATAPDMFSTAEKYFTDYNLMDIRIQSTIGLSENDIKSLSARDGVQYISGVKFTDALVKVNGEAENDIDGTQISTRAYSFSPDDIAEYLSGVNNGSYINRFELVSGRYPTAANECMVDESKLSTPESYRLGSIITLHDAAGGIPSQLNTGDFTIVGIIRCPYYLSFERGNTDIGSGKIGTFIVIPEEAFTTDYYSEAYIKIEGSDNYEPFSDEYFSYIEPYTESIDAASVNLIRERVNTLRPQLLSEITAAENDIQVRTENVNASLSELDQTIETLKQLTENGEEILAQKQKEFDDNFSSADSQFDSSKTQYTQALETYQIKKKELDKKRSEYNANNEKMNASKAAYDEIYEQCSAAQTKVDSIASTISMTNDLIGAAEAMLLQISDTQINAYSNEEIQRIVNMMQSTYPELYYSIKSLTTQGLAGEIIANLQPYLEQQKANLAQQEYEIKEKQALLNNLKIQLDKKNEELQAATAQLAAAKKELEASEQQLSDYYAGLQSIGYDITSSNIEIEIARMQAEAELKELKAQIAQAPANLETAMQKRAEAQNELDAALEYAKIQLSDAKTLYAKLDTVTWNIYDRNDTPGYSSYGQSVRNIEVLANIFPIFFFVISCLVSLTTMTRLVEEDRTLLGTYEALGYKRSAIMFKYIFYSLSACVFGSTAGILSGVFLFPFAINSAYGIMYSLPSLIYKLPWMNILIGFLIALCCTTLTTILAIAKDMTLMPSVLMRPKAPKAGRRILLERIPFLWERFGFTTKVTFRNLFRNKSRFFMTMVGIAGSCALLLASLGMYNSISDITAKQYGENAISKYDFQIVFDIPQSAADKTSAFSKAAADARIQSLGLISMKSMSGFGEAQDKKSDVYVLVPQNTEMLSSFIRFRDRETGECFSLDDTGAIITEQLAKQTGITEGDNISFSDSTGKIYSVKVSRITENYTFHYIYLSPALYSSVTGTPPEYSYAIGTISDSIKVSDPDNYANVKGLLVTDLIKTDGITTVAYTSDTTKSVTEVTDALSLVILVFFVSALILAFVVLYNLTNINIIERTRELATLKVLGFSDKEVNTYIYRENSIVSFFGIVIGIFLGIFLHKLLITFTAINTVMYGQQIAVWSYFAAIAITLLFIVLVNLLLRKKLKNIDMVLSLKSVE